MQTKELRIGNLVYSNAFKPKQVTEVDIDVLKLLSVKPDAYEPIPLTEEWLVKFGFKNWGDKYTFGLKGINIHKRQRGFVLRKSVPIIKYAHQLQNLYFALTGEELHPVEPL